ncbi:MAG TPA: PDZ domain-containing protein [Pyrinomonadaceae bacterium]|jgi:tricorn protease|nr:PDZ domain-containing protein [Pyrinomonadaceae bacterium]
MFRIVTIVAICLLICVSAFAQQTADSPLLIGRVSINQSHIAFTYAGKIWLVARAGGTAKRLTTTANEETSPVFSPDGKRIAFSQTNGNDWDVYIAQADGSGEPTRVTMMPEDDFVTAWTPDGKEVVFETTRDEETLTRLYKTSADRLALATALPLHQSYSGSISPDGNRIVYNPRTGAGDWRYYRGGYAGVLWIANLKSGALEKLSNGTYNDRNPTWVQDQIYFVSDRTGIFNLYTYDTRSKKTHQLTKYMGQGVRTASATSDAAVYVQGGRIHLLDLNSTSDRVINVSVSPDTSELAPRTASAMRSVEQFLPSPTGDRIVFSARGEVLIFDPANGSYKNLTNTPGVAERYPVISPDGKSVAYVSDESGEYALHIRSLENDSVKKIRIEEKPSFYWGLVWSPDSRKLSFPDRRLGLWLVDVAAENALKVDTSSYSAEDSWTPNFSPDSRFLAYSKRLKNRAGTVFIYDIAQKKAFQLTDGVTHTQMPVFDANGKYLYFVSSLNAGTSEFNWGVLNGVFANPLVVRRIHGVVLSKDQPSPLWPNGQPNPDAKLSEIVPQVKIDFDGLQSRFVNLPLPQRDFSQLASGGPGKLIVAIGEWSAAPGDFNSPTQSQAVYSYDLAKGGPMQKLVDQINSVDITTNGKKILYRKGRDFFLTSTDGPVKPDEGRQDFSKMEVRVVPAEEWRQMFHESMRIMRDWFYDPNHHGQNLVALENEFAAYLPTTVRRNDLNRLMQQMLGSISVSHLNVGGGDVGAPSGPGNRIGLLGADYEIANGKYRFKKIYRSTSYSAANGSFGAPLDQPGVDVREGDYLLQVNGQAVEAEKNILSYFENAVGRPTKITVSATPDGTSVRTYTVFPALGENRLRRANWAEENRKLVEKLSGGRLGYIFIEGYGGDGILNAIRGLTGYADKQGVIIDQRFNGGGITPDYLIEWMQRKPLYYYMFRGGDDIATPVNPAPPVKVMIINELNGSAAETGAFMFKLAKVGPIVGKRTFGGGIGPYYFTPSLIDGGQIRLPNRAAYDPSGASWGIENAGVAPDFDVEITPADVIAGRDPQLEKAVEVALAQISKNPASVPKRPPFPVHPGEQGYAPSIGPSVSTLPEVGSAYPPPPPKAAPPPPLAAANNMFAAYVGSYDGGQLGILVVRQEGTKLFAVPPGGERVELVPDTTADKFSAQPVGGSVTFERGPDGKVTAIIVTLPNGNVVKARKT